MEPDYADIYKNTLEDPRVPLTLRVGIAGHRVLPANQLPRIERQLKHVVKTIAEQLSTHILPHELTQELYKSPLEFKPIIRLTSSLAEGADRLIFSKQFIDNTAHGFNTELAAIIPFSVEDYTQDFLPENSVIDRDKGTVKAFEAALELLHLNNNTKRLVECNGEYSEKGKELAYSRCSKLFIEHIDLLIVVSDGQTNRSGGTAIAGTEETLSHAKNSGIPIVEIPSVSEGEINLHHFKKFDDVEYTQVFSDNAAREILEQTLLFKELFEHLPNDPFALNSNNQSENLEKKIAERKLKIVEGFRAYNNEQKHLAETDTAPDFDWQSPIQTKVISKPKSLLNNAFDGFKQLFLMGLEKERQEVINKNWKPISAPSKDATFANSNGVHQFFAAFSRADVLATYYSKLHRSSFFLIYLFAAAALAIAAVALTYQANKTLTLALVVIELILVFSIFRIYKNDSRNHHAWLHYRCLAELIRPSVYTAILAKPLSLLRVRNATEFSYREIIGHGSSSSTWICIYSETLNRHVGFGHIKLSSDALKQTNLFLHQKWIGGQIKYHLSNGFNMKCLAERLASISHILFFLTVGVLLIKLGLTLYVKSFGLSALGSLGYEFSKLSALFAALFPITATALFAIRNHAEFDISSQRSRTALAFFNSARSSLESKVKNGEDAELEIEYLKDNSVREVTDWLEIYEVKESEPG